MKAEKLRGQAPLSLCSIFLDLLFFPWQLLRPQKDSVGVGRLKETCSCLLNSTPTLDLPL
jgi:hypothetical protein